MGEALKELKADYKSKMKASSSREEKKQIRHDYKEIKPMIKKSEKLLRESKSSDEFWDQFDFPELEYSSFNDFINNKK